MPGGAPLEGVLLEQPVSPQGVHLKAPPAGVSPLQQRGHSPLDVTPSVTRAVTAAARSLIGRNYSTRLISAYLTVISTDRALFLLRGMGLYITEALLDIVYEAYGAESAVDYAYAATNVQSSVREESEIVPNAFKQAMTLSAKLE